MKAALRTVEDVDRELAAFAAHLRHPSCRSTAGWLMTWEAIDVLLDTRLDLTR